VRTGGLGLALSAAIVLLGGAWTTAAVAFGAVLLTLAGESLLTRRPAAAAPGSAFAAGAEAWRAVGEALGEGLLVADGVGRIVFVNAIARSVLRRPARDADGQLLWEALCPELASLAHEAWRAAQDPGRALAGESPHVRRAGIVCRDRVYDLAACQATSGRDGHAHGVVFLLVDSTRSFELQQLKDRFLSSVSHELRTPLTNICAYAEILRTLLPGESAEWPEFVRVIHEEGLQLSRLVDAMFDYLQLESGEAAFRNEELDGAAVVREVVLAAAAGAAASGVDLQCVEQGAAPRLVADRARLRQVVRSLLDNALKFTPAGGRVRLSVAARDEAWELRVEDSGPGVPVEHRRVVFDKFHQLRDHMTDKPPGTGLGLATSRAIVARFGGLIWCEGSALGGAGFVVLLPGAGQPRLAAAAPTQPVASQRPPNQPSAHAARPPSTVAATLPSAVP
jgi:signal transduction histidine kinase